MRRYLWIAMLGLAGCVSSSVAKMDDYAAPRPRTPKPLEARKKIAVVNFEEKAEYGRGQIGAAAADILTSFLVNSGQFAVMERQKLANVLDEHKLGSTGLVDQSTVVQAGGFLGVEYIVVGVVTNFGFTEQGTDALFYQEKRQIAESEVTVRVIDVKTSAILFAQDGRGYADTSTSGGLGFGGRMGYDQRLAGRSLRASISKVVDNLLDTIP